MPFDKNCIFCRIVAAEVPSSMVYADDNVIAFLDIGPLAEGHLLLIPQAHYREITSMPPPVCGSVASAIPILGRALLNVTKAEGFNVLCNQGKAAGQAVEHVHFHLIPRRTGDGLGYRWNAGQYAPGRAQELAAIYQQAVAAEHHKS
jgi:histidine triad (HIT) family protein